MAVSETAPLTEAGAEVVQASRAAMLTNFASRLKENAGQAFKEAKPWTEVMDRNAISKPANTTEAMGRIRKNVAYFKTNYAIIAVGTTALVMLFNPYSIIVLAFLALIWFWAYVIKVGPLYIGGRELSEREKFLVLSGTSLVVIFFLTSVGSLLFYALGMSLLVIGLHAAFRAPDDLFLDEGPEAQGGGFLSLLTGNGQPRVPVATAV